MGNQVKPQILSEEELAVLHSENPGLEKIDIFDIQIKELAKIHDPSGQNPPDLSRIRPVYIYYPWLYKTLKCVQENELFALRTNRNKNLISAEEQLVLSSSVVGIAGMSVGSSITMSLVFSGISKQIKIADNDILDTSNLNRLRESLTNIGLAKVDLTARHIYEVDPFADVHIFNEGVTQSNIDNFFEGLKLVIDEIDDFKMKVLLRKKAKETKIPLLMMTSLGDNILIDVERYDIDSKVRPFNGLLHDDGQEILENPNIDPAEIRRYSVQVVGPEYIPTQALESVTEMGKTLVGRPQLYTTIAVDGGLAGFIARNILLGKEVKSGRYFVKFSDLVGINSADFEQNETRNETLQKLMER